jgi:shikimate dehydrogenase
MEIVYGLVGKNISYSFSQGYFTKKFKHLNLSDHVYRNFDLKSIDDLPYVLNENMDRLKGFNITIPYKESIKRYLDEIDPVAEQIGAVNTVKILDGYRLKGFNTDIFGFEESLKPLLKSWHDKALVLGSGGASKAVCYVLEELGIEYRIVSRKDKNDPQFMQYGDLDAHVVKNHTLIVNTTPLGTHPDVKASPQLPYELFGEKHLLYDLIYNPAETAFLRWGKLQGAQTKNGLEMLELQAEKAWNIWNS